MVHRILLTKISNATPLTQALYHFPISYVVDGLTVSDKLNVKTIWMKQGPNLAFTFNMTTDTHAIAIVTFGYYRQPPSQRIFLL